MESINIGRRLLVDPEDDALFGRAVKALAENDIAEAEVVGRLAYAKMWDAEDADPRAILWNAVAFYLFAMFPNADRKSLIHDAEEHMRDLRRELDRADAQ